QVPNSHGVVAIGRGEVAAVGTERQAADRSRAVAEELEGLAIPSVADAHRAIGPAGSEVTTVGAVGDGQDLSFMVLDLADSPARAGVPNLNARTLSGEGQGQPIGAVGQTAHALGPTRPQDSVFISSRNAV